MCVRAVVVHGARMHLRQFLRGRDLDDVPAAVHERSIKLDVVWFVLEAVDAARFVVESPFKADRLVFEFAVGS